MNYSTLHASDILDMAIQIERQGIQFYEACAASKFQPEVLYVFGNLIVQEHSHIGVFSQMKIELEDFSVPETYPGEMRNYMDSFGGDHVFYGLTEAVQQSGDIEDPLKAIEFGIGFEQRSVLFYIALREVIRNSTTKLVDDVIAQENGHIRWLLALRHQLGEGQS